MGKKSKQAQKRKDPYYFKAKLAGFRARSAFKLMQLNSKFEFLQKSRVCVDLCAAPGSWMQVAKKYMPLSSVIVGVDLYPIKPIPGTLSIVGDITTEKVRQDLKSTLKTWKADLVLHDGAPNVGQNWLQDAYQQNLLTLHAFKLACELLQKGGYFVTKIFRSKDYFNLEYIFKKLFKRVDATKPQASRHESAEIFVVCHGFLAPDKIDAQFFSPKHVFQELNPEPKNKLNILKPDKVRQKAEGYPEGATTLYNKVDVSAFIEASNFVEVLQEASELHFDDEAIKNHKLTTAAIVENCKDIKVLGRKDLRLLLNWRKNIKDDLEKMKKEKKALENKKAEVEEEENEEEKEELELDELQKKIVEMKAEQARAEKQTRKRKMKEKKKLEEKLRLQSVIPGDPGPTETGQHGLFNLNRLSQVQDMDTVVDQEGDIVVSGSEEEEEEKEPTYRRYRKGEGRLDKTGRFYMTGGDKEIYEQVEESDDDDKETLAFKDNKTQDDLKDVGSDEDDPDAVNPLVTDLVGDSRDERRARKAESWFSKDIFNDLETEMEEDLEIDKAVKNFESSGGIVLKKKESEKDQTNEESKTEEAYESGYTSDHVKDSDSDSDSDSDTDSDTEKKQEIGPQLPGYAVGAKIVANQTVKRRLEREELDAVGLALATQMIHSKKVKRDFMDNGWNRYMVGDEDDLPEWFVRDEKMYNNPVIDVDPEDLKMYRDRGKDVNARTIKKVVEAKARKQRRTKKRMEKARKKAENVTNNADMSEREKSQEIKKLYKKALNPLKKKETKYVVMKKRHGGKKPKGTKGPYKMVDKRLKKDVRSQKKAEKEKQKTGKGTKGKRMGRKK